MASVDLRLFDEELNIDRIGARRCDVAAPTSAARPYKKGFKMNLIDKGPRNGPEWVMAVIVIATSAKIDVMVADIVIVALGTYTMWSDYRSRR